MDKFYWVGLNIYLKIYFPWQKKSKILNIVQQKESNLTKRYLIFFLNEQKSVRYYQNTNIFEKTGWRGKRPITIFEDLFVENLLRFIKKHIQETQYI